MLSQGTASVWPKNQLLLLVGHKSHTYMWGLQYDHCCTRDHDRVHWDTDCPPPSGDHGLYRRVPASHHWPLTGESQRHQPSTSAFRPSSSFLLWTKVSVSSLTKQTNKHLLNAKNFVKVLSYKKQEFLFTSANEWIMNMMMSVVFPFLLLWQSVMTNTAQGRRNSFGLNSSRSRRVHHITVEVYDHRQAWRLEQDMTSHILNHPHEGETAKWKGVSKPVPSDILPPARLYHLNLPTWCCQLFRYPCIWGIVLLQTTIPGLVARTHV